jgi:hypothetical protein
LASLLKKATPGKETLKKNRVRGESQSVASIAFEPE